MDRLKAMALSAAALAVDPNNFLLAGESADSGTKESPAIRDRSEVRVYDGRRGNKYIPHTGLKQINKGRKRVGLPPLEPAAKEGQTLTLTVPELGEIQVNR